MRTYSISRRKISQGKKTWYGRSSDQDSGEVRYISLKTEKKKEAEEWLARMNASRFSPQVKKQMDVDIREASLAFLRGVEASKGKGSSTLKVYSTQQAALLGWCAANGIDSLAEFSPAHAGAFVSTFAGQASVTVRQKIVNLRSFFKWALDTYEVQKQNPMRSVKPPKADVSRERHFWTQEQIDRILDAAPSPVHRVFWALMAFAGLRRSEAIGVRPCDIRDGHLHIVGKGAKFARIPVSDRLREELLRVGDIASDSPYVGGYVERESVLENACRRAGIIAEGHPHFHRFRHSFASNLLRAGASITETQRLMRHSNVQLTLAVYSHLLPEDLARAVNLIK